MQRLKVLLLAAMAVFAVGAAFSATAFGGIEALDEANKPAKASFKGLSAVKTDLGILNESQLVLCGETHTEGELEATGKLGPFHISFLKCDTSSGGTCTGLGDPSGTILALGVIHLATAALNLNVGLVEFLTEHLHFECTVLFVKKLILVLGDYLCKIEPINVLVEKAKVKCLRGANHGDPWLVEYENDKGEDVTLANPLKATTSDGVEEMASEESSAAIEVTLTPKVKLDV